MKLKEILSQLKQTATDIKVAKPFCCGGVVRDKYMNRLDHVADLDLTNGEKSIGYLAQEYADRMKKNFNLTYKTMEDGHSTIFLGNLKMDFSSNFVVSGIDGYLSKLNISNPTDLQCEMFSRDFTCNALLMDVELKHIYDSTKRGFEDIDKKIVSTCLSPEITLTSSRNRVIRSIYLCSKLGFNLDPHIIAFVKKHPESLKIGTPKSLEEKLTQAFQYDADKASYLLSQMGLWNHVPILEPMKPYYQKSLTKSAYFQGTEQPKPHGQKQYKSDPAVLIQPRFREPFYRNYDYTYQTGLHENPVHSSGVSWMSMNQFKSIREFLEHNRKLLKGKYVADDFIIEDTEENRAIREQMMKTRAAVLSQIVKTAIDFPLDDSYQSDPILENSSEYTDPIQIGSSSPQDVAIFPNDTGLGEMETYPYSAQIGGLLDTYTPRNDFEGKSVDQLNFGRDYSEDDAEPDELNYEDLAKLLQDMLTPNEGVGLYGLPDGISPVSDLDADQTINQPNPYFGETNMGNTMYQDKTNI